MPTSHAASPADVSADPFVGGAFASVGIVTVTNTDLHDDERALMSVMAEARQASFAAGRQALRAALRAVAPDHAAAPLLRTTRGGPHLPAGTTGSISHKRARAVAIAAVSERTFVGIDLEQRPTEVDLSRISIADRILTSRELDALHHLDALAHREATLLRFALKEAVYKAIDPLVQRYVRFTEVELDVHDGGDVAVHLRLPDLDATRVQVDARWRHDGDWIIAVARSTTYGG